MYAARLNSNIRCIEISDAVEHERRLQKLNSNIRCIEISDDDY